MPKKKKEPRVATAKVVDKYELYEASVQCSEAEVNFIEEKFSELRGRPARSLREDFCGSAQVCREWIERNNKNLAIGVDLDKTVLAWGYKKNFSNLSKSKKSRVNLINSDVLSVSTPNQDVICATNFSYWQFSDRSVLGQYFTRVRKCLNHDGIFVLDFYGGHDATKNLKEETQYDDFVYIWEQSSFNPINNMQLCYIHFRFPDGSKIDRAFTYSWRFWSIREIREILVNAGFSQSYVYWQDWDEEKNEATSDFNIVEKVDNDAAWIGYIVALF